MLHKLKGKDVIKKKMLYVAGQMFIQHEKELVESSQIIKGYEDYIGDNKIKNDVLNKLYKKIISDEKVVC